MRVPYSKVYKMSGQRAQRKRRTVLFFFAYNAMLKGLPRRRAAYTLSVYQKSADDASSIPPQFRVEKWIGHGPRQQVSDILRKTRTAQLSSTHPFTWF